MTAPELPIRSGFAGVDQTEDPAMYIRRLDETGGHPFWQTIKHRILALLDLQLGEHVLDVGCGTGDDVRMLARIVGPAGRAVGIDVSATMIAEARKRTDDSALAVEFYQGDVCELPFPGESFDGCRAERVLQHLDDPAQALREMVRIVRPGGRIVAVEPDYGAMTIVGSDPALTRTILSCRCSHFRSGRVGSQLPTLFREMRLDDIALTFLVMTTADLQEGERQVLAKYVDGAREVGKVSIEEGNAWLADMHEASCHGEYRHAIPIVLVSGRKP